VDCIIYVEMPYGFSRPGHVLKLNKALEGIKQGAHLWMEHNRKVLESLGFKASLAEPSLYKHVTSNIIIAVFADDIAAAYDGSARAEYEAIKQSYVQQIKVRTTAIVPLAVFTGVSIHRDRGRGTLTITQTEYIDLLAQRYKGKFTERSTPGPTSASGRKQFERMAVQTDKEAGEEIPQTEYLRLVGGLIWPASMTRPDIAFYAAYLASFNSRPTQQHFDCTARLRDSR